MRRRTPKLFRKAKSNAVWPPRELRFPSPSHKPKSWRDFFDRAPLPSEDFMQERVDLPPQHRKGEKWNASSSEASETRSTVWKPGG